MKHFSSVHLARRVIIYCSVLHLSLSLYGQPTDRNIVGKVMAGYQTWFACYGDGSPVNSWRHWNSGGEYGSNFPDPAAGRVTFEIYPDVTAYPQEQLFQTSLANLGDGRPSQLFGSYPEPIVEQHFTWMEEHGIDGVGLQRFISETHDPVFKMHRDSMASRVSRAAVRHDRLFYMMYDISGFSYAELEYLKGDWTNTIENQLHIPESPAYAMQDGKPVVCFWGIGFQHVYFEPNEMLELINWFKSEGYYVIGGVPTHWREGINDSRPGYEEVYKALDMISPWTVGRYSTDEEVDDWYRDQILIPDFEYCLSYGIDFQPVLFPGFAWSNWNGGFPNHIPRRSGDLFWKQAYNIRQAGIPSAYIAMLDEYDEGTAILPAADSYLSVPTDQYFQTYSVDGVYCSSDFYLRLAGEITRLIKKEISSSSSFSTPFTNGPVFLRTSLEPGYDAMNTWNNVVDETSVATGVEGDGPGGLPICAISQGDTHVGDYSIVLKGDDISSNNSFCYYKIFNVNIPVSDITYLTYWFKPENENSRRIGIDLVMSDGSNLRDLGAFDLDGQGMHPGAGRGVVNEWTQIRCRIGDWLNGKTIDRILLAYDLAPETGNFSAYIDDIIVHDGELISGIKQIKAEASLTFDVFPNPVSGDILNITLPESHRTAQTTVYLYDVLGRLRNTTLISQENNFIAMDGLENGIFFLGIKQGSLTGRKPFIRL